MDERYGHCSAPKSESTVLATFVVDDVREWYEHLRKNGVTIISELLSRPEIQIEAFFFEDPEGYALEAQSFLNPVLRPVFGQREILEKSGPVHEQSLQHCFRVKKFG